MDTFNEQQLSMCETNELVNYIAELRVKNDELEKEKEELYDEDGIECSLTYRELDEEHDELKEKWQELKQENEELKEQLNTIFPSKTEQAVISKYQVQRTNNLRTINQLEKEIEDLERTLKTRKSCNEAMYSQVVYASFHEEQMKLKNEEIEKLKAEVDKLKNPVIYDRDMRCSQLDMRIGYSFCHDFFELMFDERDIEESIVEDQEEYVWSEVSKCISNAIENYIRNPVGEINCHITDEVGECYHKLDTQGCFKEVEDE